MRKFRGHFLTAFDGAEYNRFFSKMSDKALKNYFGNDNTLWYDENNDVIYEFCNGNT